MKGPWQLFDNDVDPYQMNNFINNPDYAILKSDLDQRLNRKLKLNKNDFLEGGHYIQKWGYKVNELGTVPYTN